MLAQKHGKDGRVLEPARVVHAPTWLARTSMGFPTPPPSLAPPQTLLPPGPGDVPADVERLGAGEGLLLGDSILSIDGVDVRKWPLAKIGPALRGTRGACLAALAAVHHSCGRGKGCGRGSGFERWGGAEAGNGRRESGRENPRSTLARVVCTEWRGLWHARNLRYAPS
jgi:hypothetical protein